MLFGLSSVIGVVNSEMKHKTYFEEGCVTGREDLVQVLPQLSHSSQALLGEMHPKHQVCVLLRVERAPCGGVAYSFRLVGAF